MSEFKFPAALVRDSAGHATITAFNVNDESGIKVADDRHPHFNAIVEGLRQGDPSVWDLFDVASGMMRRFEKVTDRVSYDGENILWDGDPVHSVIANQVKRALEAGEENYEALAKFWEKLESNPNEHSREQAYEFLASHDFQITADGDLVGYKGMYDNGDGTYSSWHASTVEDKPSAYVNGQPLPALQKVVASLGDEVSMPRSEVKHDPNQTCDRGLHVATYAYAAGYGNVVVEILTNPRDIVSVPNDAHGEKVRACAFKMNRIVSEANTGGPVLKTDEQPSWVPDVSYRG